MAKTLQWGLLSTARINGKIIPAIRAARGHALRAIASRDLERANRYAWQWMIPKTYGSYEELIADPTIDVIYNPLPNHLHAEWTIRAAQHGKHVLCEKPLALSTQEVDAIAVAAEENHVVVAEAFIYRSHPRTLKIQELIQAGLIGGARHINSTYTISLGRPDNYRWLPEAGGGCLLDLGCYPVSYSRLVMGANPVEVSGIAKWTASGVDSTFTGQMTFAGGTIARFFVSFELQYLSRLEIHGSLGTLITESPFIPSRSKPFYLLKGGERFKIPAPVPTPLYKAEVVDLGRSILTGAPPRVPLSESRGINQILTALLESAKKGAPVRL